MSVPKAALLPVNGTDWPTTQSVCAKLVGTTKQLAARATKGNKFLNGMGMDLQDDLLEDYQMPRLAHYGGKVNSRLIFVRTCVQCNKVSASTAEPSS